MIINKVTSETIYKAVDARKQISKLGFTQDEFDRYCHTLNRISSLDYNDELLNGFNLDKFLVAKSFKGLVIPRKISLEEGTNYIDLRADSYVNYSPEDAGYDKDIKDMKPLEFNTITSCLFSAKRKTMADGDVFKVTEINGAKSLTNYKDRIVCREEGKQFSDLHVLANATPFIPIDFSMTFQYDNYYTVSMEVMLEDWIEKALDDLSTEF